MRPTRAEVDLDAIAANARRLRAAAGPAALMAVVKADGYGHGAVPVARAALAAGASWLGVASVEEGVELRRAGVEAAVLVLGWTPAFQAAQGVAWDLRLAAVSGEHAVELAAAAGRGWEPDGEGAARGEGRREGAPRAGRRRGALRLHLKVDTGMGRLGIPATAPSLVAAAAEEAVRVARLPGVELEGVFTHLARSEEAGEGEEFTRRQLELFLDLTGRLERAGLRLLRHAANSGAILGRRGVDLDLVRAGISLYGYHPAGPAAPVEEAAGLRPALRWLSAVAQVKEVPAGTPVSYGGTFVTERPSRLGVVPVGYADGFSRRLSGKGRVLVRGRRAPVVGRVCMDQIVVDLSEAGPVEAGEEVVLLGAQDGEAIWADEMAGWLGTISYEVLCGIGRRVPRVYRLAGGDAGRPGRGWTPAGGDGRREEGRGGTPAGGDGHREEGRGGAERSAPAYRWR